MKTKYATLVHIALIQRIKEIMTFEGLCGAEQLKNGVRFLCGGKVYLESLTSNRMIVGYIMSEDVNGKWRYKLLTNEEVEIESVVFDKQTKCYDMPKVVHPDYRLVGYDPVRLHLSKKGDVKYTFARFGFHIDDNSLVVEHTE